MERLTADNTLQQLRREGGREGGWEGGGREEGRGEEGGVKCGSAVRDEVLEV